MSEAGAALGRAPPWSAAAADGRCLSGVGTRPAPRHTCPDSLARAWSAWAARPPLGCPSSSSPARALRADAARRSTRLIAPSPPALVPGTAAPPARVDASSPTRRRRGVADRRRGAELARRDTARRASSSASAAESTSSSTPCTRILAMREGGRRRATCREKRTGAGGRERSESVVCMCVWWCVRTSHARNMTALASRGAHVRGPMCCRGLNAGGACVSECVRTQPRHHRCGGQRTWGRCIGPWPPCRRGRCSR